MDHQEIPKLSDRLRAALAEEMQKMPPDMDPEIGAQTAMKAIAARIYNGEEGIIDLSNPGDNLALTLAQLA